MLENRTIKLSLFTSTGGMLNKKVMPDGRVASQGAGRFWRGTVATHEVKCLQEFAELRDALTGAQAFAYGVPNGGDGEVVSRSKASEFPGAITRTRENFGWAGDADRIWMLDHDPRADDNYRPSQLYVILMEVMPELAGVEVLWTPSASSYIEEIATGELISDITGQRLYVRLGPGVDSVELAKVLERRLWKAGYGWIMISKAGSALKRTLFDMSVFQPERLDFAALPRPDKRYQSAAGGKWKLMSEGGALERFEKQPDDMSDLSIDTLFAEEKEKRKPEIKATQDAWVEEMARKHPEKPREVFERACKTHTLMGDFVLYLDDGPAEGVAVAEVLADRNKYHGATLGDPLEPDYGGRRGKAQLYLHQVQPRIYSHAHGGRHYTLSLRTGKVVVTAGEIPNVLDHVAEVLAKQADVYRTTAGLTQIRYNDQGHAGPVLLGVVETELLAARVIEFKKLRSAGNGTLEEAPRDVGGDMAKKIQTVAGSPRSPVRLLTAVNRYPSMTLSGRLIQEPGFDKETGILYAPDEAARPVPEEFINRQGAEQALSYLLAPFAHYQFEDEAADRGTLLAMLLTAAVRPLLDTAPGFLIDASTAGSGKTKLAVCASLLAGDEGQMDTWPTTREEIGKALFARFLELPRAIIFDNVVSGIGGGELAKAMTTPSYSQRRLGASENAVASTKSLMIWTGNNVAIDGDINRRVFRIRIETGKENPWNTAHPFDPVTVVRQRRAALVQAALIIMAAAVKENDIQHPAPFGSFEQWSRSVRDAVVWMGYPDPVARIEENYVLDGETQDFLAFVEVWTGLFGEEWVVPKPDNEKIHSLVMQLESHGVDARGRKLPYLLRRYFGRVQNCSVLRRRKLPGRNGFEWRVERVR